MKKNIILIGILFLIQCIVITLIKGFSFPLLVLFTLLLIFTCVSFEDWKTGEISVGLNVAIFILSIIYAAISNFDIKVIGFNLLVFVLPFILTETIFQVFINRGKDEERFLIGGGDIILFASMSMLLSTVNMMVMLFFACLFSLIASKIINKTMVHFAPFIQMGLLIAFLFGDRIMSLFIIGI